MLSAEKNKPKKVISLLLMSLLEVCMKNSSEPDEIIMIGV